MEEELCSPDFMLLTSLREASDSDSDLPLSEIDHPTPSPTPTRYRLPASLHQLHTNLSNSDSPSSLSGTSSIGSNDSPLSSSITPSLFHFKLKTFLLCKFFPLQLFFFFRTDFTDSLDCLLILLSISVFYF